MCFNFSNKKTPKCQNEGVFDEAVIEKKKIIDLKIWLLMVSDCPILVLFHLLLDKMRTYFQYCY